MAGAGVPVLEREGGGLWFQGRVWGALTGSGEGAVGLSASTPEQSRATARQVVSAQESDPHDGSHCAQPSGPPAPTPDQLPYPHCDRPQGGRRMPMNGHAAPAQPAQPQPQSWGCRMDWGHLAQVISSALSPGPPHLVTLGEAQTRAGTQEGRQARVRSGRTMPLGSGLL